ncbi:hypothetical protein GT354_22515 [Streptomyces sp. SID3343]|nr:hypothetical protein [Streptomyces sp. SID3343]
MISVKPSPVAAWFHHLLTKPVIELDGTEHVAKWGKQEIPVPPGDHRISVYFRYRGQADARLAEASTQFITGQTSRRVEITAGLGPLNGSGFRIGEPAVR